jgi:hypothetical protein
MANSAEEMLPHERLTLQVGSCVVLTMLGLGLELGGWSAWSVLPAAGGYLLWVVAYSEATVRLQKAPSSPGHEDRPTNTGGDDRPEEGEQQRPIAA